MEARLKPLLLLLALGVAGCEAQAPTAAPEAKPTDAAAPTVAAPAGDLLIRERSIDLDFGWRMVPDVAAYPALLAELRRDATERLAEATANAAEDRAARPADAPFFGHYFQQNWRVEADTSRLLSLVAETDTFTGGAHGMSFAGGVIWDKAAGKQLALQDLFSDWAAARRIIEPVYCRALDQEREQRRGQPKTGRLFDDCPPLLEQTVTLAGWNESTAGGLKVYLDPYTAGPYAEGRYDIWVFPEPALSTLVKPEYRPKG